MAQINCFYESKILKCKTAMNVILPDNGRVADAPVFYLLHGMDGNYLTWCDNTEIEEIAEEYGIAVVMPDAKNSFYSDMATGERYYTHMTQEVPEAARRYFGISNQRAKSHIAGISMGGLGAFKLALLNHRNFATAASLSGALDMAKRIQSGKVSDEREQAMFEAVLGKDFAVEKTDNDLLYVLRCAAESGDDLPVLYQYCGWDDFLYSDNLRFRDLARSLHVRHKYIETPGDHRWVYWAEQIRDYIPWALHCNF